MEATTTTTTATATSTSASSLPLPGSSSPAPSGGRSRASSTSSSGTPSVWRMVCLQGTILTREGEVENAADRLDAAVNALYATCLNGHSAKRLTWVCGRGQRRSAVTDKVGEALDACEAAQSNLVDLFHACLTDLRVVSKSLAQAIDLSLASAPEPVVDTPSQQTTADADTDRTETTPKPANCRHASTASNASRQSQSQSRPRRRGSRSPTTPRSPRAPSSPSASLLRLSMHAVDARLLGAARRARQSLDLDDACSDVHSVVDDEEEEESVFADVDSCRHEPEEDSDGSVTSDDEDDGDDDSDDEGYNSRWSKESAYRYDKDALATPKQLASLIRWCEAQQELLQRTAVNALSNLDVTLNEMMSWKAVRNFRPAFHALQQQAQRLAGMVETCAPLSGWRMTVASTITDRVQAFFVQAEERITRTQMTARVLWHDIERAHKRCCHKLVNLPRKSNFATERAFEDAVTEYLQRAFHFVTFRETLRTTPSWREPWNNVPRRLGARRVSGAQLAAAGPSSSSNDGVSTTETTTTETVAQQQSTASHDHHQQRGRESTVVFPPDSDDSDRRTSVETVSTTFTPSANSSAAPTITTTAPTTTRGEAFLLVV